LLAYHLGGIGNTKIPYLQKWLARPNKLQMPCMRGRKESNPSAVGHTESSQAHRKELNSQKTFKIHHIAVFSDMSRLHISVAFVVNRSLHFSRSTRESRLLWLFDGRKAVQLHHSIMESEDLNKALFEKVLQLIAEKDGTNY
jgi:hypothetical protein